MCSFSEESVSLMGFVKDVYQKKSDEWEEKQEKDFKKREEMSDAT